MPDGLSIGALARATGIPADTLRTWERRYGFPFAERTASGHRRYPLETVDRLELVGRALSAGNKPSQVLEMSADELQRLLVATGDGPIHVVSSAPAKGRPLAELFESVLSFDAGGVDAVLRREWSARGALRFIDEVSVPFVRELGDRWERGDIAVGHEHFASERLRQFLFSEFRAMTMGSRGPRVVCATLPGEEHVLGLHMAAVVVALSGRRLVFLGANAPVGDVAAAARHTAAQAILISASVALERRVVDECMRQLLNAASGMQIIVGGAGFADYTGPVVKLSSFDALSLWLAQRDPAGPALPGSG